MRTWSAGLGLAAALALGGCAQPGPGASIEAASFSERTRAAQAETPQFLKKLFGLSEPAASPALQKRLGDELAAKMLKKLRLSSDKALKARAEAILRRLAASGAAGGGPWRVHVVEDKTANAFTTGGGHIFITSGMMNILRDEDRIAAVLAHEMGHNILSHIIQAQRKKAETRETHRYSREVISERMKLDWLGRMVSFLATTSLNRYSRNQEDEADAKGMEILVAAGYEPNAALRTFDRLSGVYKDQPALVNFFYGNHPTYRYRRWHLVNLIRAHYRKQAGLPPVRRANFGAAPRKAPPPAPSGAPAENTGEEPVEGLW